MESLVDKGLVLALFEEGAHALLLVGALEAGAEGLLLDHDGAVNVDLKTVVDGLLGWARCQRSGRRAFPPRRRGQKADRPR